MPFYAVLSYCCDGSGTPFVEFTDSTSELVRILLANGGGGQELTVYEINNDDFGFDVKALSPQTPPTLPTKEPKLPDRERGLVILGLQLLRELVYREVQAQTGNMPEPTEKIGAGFLFGEGRLFKSEDLANLFFSWAVDTSFTVGEIVKLRQKFSRAPQTD